MGKFFLGVLVGGVTGAIAWSKLRKTDYYQQIQETIRKTSKSTANRVEKEVNAVV